MPPRRQKNPSAAKLPASRLPLGTHLPTDDELRPTSRNTDRSAPSPPSTAASDAEAATHIDIKHHPAFKSTTDPTTESTDMPSDMSTSDASQVSQPAHSMAEAKLRRQQERIQNAEAALAAPLHLDRREPSRGKNKTNWKPLDIEWDTAERVKNEGGIPVQTTTRTNTIYGPAFSRETSLSRSLSSISQQTGATDSERHDSMTDTAGFQTYHGRRGRKHPDELAATEDSKQEERQATVEGSYDKREMCKVFGRELPGLDFISSNCGFKDAQLQFVQHPNGDVSAHMWSHNRYMWENIGNFSNIRKRVEGQLASDRLKGETAWQNLQKNTLAYFRAIAKQREQTTMGYDFGQAEIQQILPQPPETMKPPEPRQAASPATSASSHQPSDTGPPIFNPGKQQTVATGPQHISQPKPQTQRPSVVSRFPFLSNEQVGGKEDPFSASGIFLQPNETAAPTTRTNPQPAKSTTDALSSNPFLSTNPTAKSTSTDTSTSQARPQAGRPKHDIAPALTGLSGLFPLNTAKLSSMSLGQQAERRQASQASLGSAGTPSRNKPATPMSSREAMRDQLWKVSEFAQQRSNSQANVRTVLHDPFQSQSVKSEESRTEPFPDYDMRSESDGSQMHLPHGYTQRTQPTYRNWADSQPALNGTKPTAIVTVRPEESLADSVPDTEVQSGGRVASFQSSGATYVAEEQPNTTNVGKKSYDEELKDWWNSGNNRFARQEDFYQRIKESEMRNPSTRTSAYTHTTPSTRPRPIGAPPSGRYSSSTTASPQKPDVPFNKTMTRVLIPVYENLASYMQGPVEKRRDYWSNWSQPPEWCIDRSANGNKSFFDDGWGQPPARVGRDPRYRALPGELRFGGFSPGALSGSPRGSGGLSAIPGLRGSVGFGVGGAGRF